MHLTELEIERLNHISTREELSRCASMCIVKDRQLLYHAVGARLGISGPFRISADGAVTPEALPQEAPSQEW